MYPPIFTYTTIIRHYLRPWENRLRILHALRFRKNRRIGNVSGAAHIHVYAYAIIDIGIARIQHVIYFVIWSVFLLRPISYIYIYDYYPTIFVRVRFFSPFLLIGYTNLMICNDALRQPTLYQYYIRIRVVRAVWTSRRYVWLTEFSFSVPYRFREILMSNGRWTVYAVQSPPYSKLPYNRRYVFISFVYTYTASDNIVYYCSCRSMAWNIGS